MYIHVFARTIHLIIKAIIIINLLPSSMLELGAYLCVLHKVRIASVHAVDSTGL